MEKLINDLWKKVSKSSSVVFLVDKLLRVYFFVDKTTVSILSLWLRKSNFFEEQEVDSHIIIKVSKGVSEKYLMFINKKGSRIVEPLNQIIYLKDLSGKLFARKSPQEFFKDDFQDGKFQIVSINELNEITNVAQKREQFNPDRLNARLILNYYNKNFETGDIKIPQKEMPEEKLNPYGNFGQSFDMTPMPPLKKSQVNWRKKLFRKRESHKDFFDSVKC